MNMQAMHAGEKGAILHVNRQHIALNAKDGGDRPVYTLKPNGPNSTAIYAREVEWRGRTKAVHDGSQLKCGARAWIEIAAGSPLVIHDAMSFAEARAAA